MRWMIGLVLMISQLTAAAAPSSSSTSLKYNVKPLEVGIGAESRLQTSVMGEGSREGIEFFSAHLTYYWPAWSLGVELGTHDRESAVGNLSIMTRRWEMLGSGSYVGHFGASGIYTLGLLLGSTFDQIRTTLDVQVVTKRSEPDLMGGIEASLGGVWKYGAPRLYIRYVQVGAEPEGQFGIGLSVGYRFGL